MEEGEGRMCHVEQCAVEERDEKYDQRYEQAHEYNDEADLEQFDEGFEQGAETAAGLGLLIDVIGKFAGAVHAAYDLFVECLGVDGLAAHLQTFGCRLCLWNDGPQYQIDD